MHKFFRDRYRVSRHVLPDLTTWWTAESRWWWCPIWFSIHNALHGPNDDLEAKRYDSCEKACDVVDRIQQLYVNTPKPVVTHQLRDNPHV